ncbi:MAG: Mu transposase domain-containing protein [Bryobacteraceae bacterium]
MSQTGRYSRLAVRRSGPATLQPLPAERYLIARWKTVRANIDYHVEVDRHYYSIPHPTRRSADGGAIHRHYASR